AVAARPAGRRLIASRGRWTWSAGHLPGRHAAARWHRLSFPGRDGFAAARARRPAHRPGAARDVRSGASGGVAAGAVAVLLARPTGFFPRSGRGLFAVPAGFPALLGACSAAFAVGGLAASRTARAGLRFLVRVRSAGSAVPLAAVRCFFRLLACFRLLAALPRSVFGGFLVGCGVL